MRTWGVRGTLLAGAVVIVLGSTHAAWGGVDEGKALYEKKCKLCHSIAGEGGKRAEKGGPLDGVGGKHDAAWMLAYLKDPKAQKPDSKMPKSKLDEKSLQDVVAFLMTLK